MRTDAWTALGTRLTATTAAGALEEAGLAGWNLTKEPMTALGTRVPGKVAVIGAPGVLGVVGERYPLLQNEDRIAALDGLPGNYYAAGSFDGKVYVDKIDKKFSGEYHFALMWSFDGSIPLSLACSHVTAGTLVTVNLGAYNGVCGAYSNVSKLRSTPLDRTAFERLIVQQWGPKPGAAPATVTRTQGKLEAMSRLFTGSTAWDGLVALATWYDHYSPVRGGDLMRARKAILEPAFKRQARQLMESVIQR